jgi:hypothetical protein
MMPRPLVTAAEIFASSKSVDGNADAARSTTQWPTPLRASAYHGVIGDIVKTIEPNTEADPAALDRPHESRNC